MPDITTYLPFVNPTLIFFVVLLIILFSPIVMAKLRIPHIIGMVLAGVIIGPHCLNILAYDSSFKLFGNVGLYYIMFLAGLEMNMGNFNNNRSKTLTHGILAFAIPITIGFFINRELLHYGMLTSVLLASMYASHTLVAYPIVMRYGLSQQRSVTIAIGATALTDTLTLLVLAIVSDVFKGQINFWYCAALVAKVSVSFFVIIYFFPRIARRFFKRYDDKVTQFIFSLAMCFLGAGIMQVVGLEGLLGAFVAGLVMNRYIPHVSTLMNHLEFVGNAIFIPYFLIGVGMMVNVHILFNGWSTWEVALTMICVALVTKWVASLATQQIFRMKAIERELIYGLSNAQAGATLAAVLVGYGLILPNGQRLLNDEVLNGTIILILVTCLFSSLTTERASKKMALREKNIPKDVVPDDEKVLIAISRPETMRSLVDMAILTHNFKLNSGMIALNVTLDDKYIKDRQQGGKEMLEHAEKIANDSNVTMQTQNRLTTNIVNGICHTFRENDASEIIMGLRNSNAEGDDIFGSCNQGIIREINNQIIMCRIRRPLNTTRKIHVAIPSRVEFEPGFYRWIERIARLAANLDCRAVFHGRDDTLALIREYMQNRYPETRTEYDQMQHWNEFPTLGKVVNEDHLLVVITARRGTVSYKPTFEKLPSEIKENFTNRDLVIIFPDQHGEPVNFITTVEPQHRFERSAYEIILEWIRRKLKR